MNHKIKVGTSLTIKKGFWKQAFSLLYCGMPNKDTFVLSPFIYTGYQGYSPNIYYGVKSRNIEINNKEFRVIDVTPEYITLAE